MTNFKPCDEQLILCYRQNSKEAYDYLLKSKHQAVLPLLKKYATQCKPLDRISMISTPFFLSLFIKLFAGTFSILSPFKPIF